jgi:hypothetical protein
MRRSAHDPLAEPGMEFLGMEWANRSGTALICDRCSFVHTFAGGDYELWVPSDGYPR